MSELRGHLKALVETPAHALALIRRAGIVSAAAHVEGVPNLVEEITGERMRGSWWGHPKGRLIFRLSGSLEESNEVVALQLLEGKATYVHCALWPELLAVVLDEPWRAARAKTLNAGARALWKKVEAATRGGDARAPVKALEESLLVHCASEHTAKGRHEKRLTAWRHWARDHRVKPATSGPEAALKKLQKKAGGLPTALAGP